VGILARSDIFHAITRETPDWGVIEAGCEVIDVKHAVLVRDIMRRDTIPCRPTAPIEDVIKIIDSNDIQRVAVVDKDDRLLGLISDSNLIGMFGDHRAGLWDYLVRKLPFTELAKRHEELIRRTKAKTAWEAMKVDLVTVKEETSGGRSHQTDG